MQMSIHETKLSSETLNRIDRVAEILSESSGLTLDQVTNTLVGLATLGYYDGLLEHTLVDTCTEYGWVNPSNEPITSEVI